MASKKTVFVRIALCITAILAIALCGCDDLGAYSDVDEYYDSFGENIVLLDGSKGVNEYSVEKYFYNEESREDFLEGEDKVEQSDYVYIAIRFEKTIDVDSLALYLRSDTDAMVYMNFYVTNYIPSSWKTLSDLEAENSGTTDTDTDTDLEGGVTDGTDTDADADGGENSEGEESASPTYDEPAPDSRIGEIAVSLKAEKWNSFTLESFRVNGKTEKSIQINKAHYILIQIRNNSGVREFDEDKKVYVDAQTKIELPSVKVTMTNLMIRALSLDDETQSQEGET